MTNPLIGQLLPPKIEIKTADEMAQEMQAVAAGQRIDLAMQAAIATMIFLTIVANTNKKGAEAFVDLIAEQIKEGVRSNWQQVVERLQSDHGALN